jgi:hypothetical protein
MIGSSTTCERHPGDVRFTPENRTSIDRPVMTQKWSVVEMLPLVEAQETERRAVSESP